MGYHKKIEWKEVVKIVNALTNELTCWVDERIDPERAYVSNNSFGERSYISNNVKIVGDTTKKFTWASLGEAGTTRICLTSASSGNELIFKKRDGTYWDMEYIPFDGDPNYRGYYFFLFLGAIDD